MLYLSKHFYKFYYVKIICTQNSMQFTKLCYRPIYDLTGFAVRFESGISVIDRINFVIKIPLRQGLLIKVDERAKLFELRKPRLELSLTGVEIAPSPCQSCP
jgi:hypothetical protein